VPSVLLNQWEVVNKDKKITYEVVREWVSSAKAEIDHSCFLMLSNGDEASINSGLEYITPSAFISQGPGSWPVPTDFDLHRSGFKNEFDPILARDVKYIFSRSSIQTV